MYKEKKRNERSTMMNRNDPALMFYVLSRSLHTRPVHLQMQTLDVFIVMLYSIMFAYGNEKIRMKRLLLLWQQIFLATRTFHSCFCMNSHSRSLCGFFRDRSCRFLRIYLEPLFSRLKNKNCICNPFILSILYSMSVISIFELKLEEKELRRLIQFISNSIQNKVNWKAQ